MDGNLFLRSVLGTGGHIGCRTRPNDRQRLDLVDASVAGVELDVQVVTPDLTRDEPPEIFLNSLALLVELVHA